MTFKSKVLHFQLLPILSGVQNVSLNEIKVLKDYFHFEAACAYPGPFSEALNEHGVKTHFFDRLKHEIHIINDLIVFLQLLKFFRREKYNVVHTHSSKPGILGRIAAKITGTPMVVHTVHGFAFGFSANPIIKFIFFVLEFIAARFTDRIFVMNQNDYNFCTRKLFLNKKKVIFLANGIDDHLFEINPSDSSNYLIQKEDQDKIKIGFVGRLDNQKNPSILIEAYNLLPERLKVKSKLYFIGDGELKKVLVQKVEAFDLKENIVFFGWVKNASEHVKEFDLFVLPSLYEGMPLSIIEAMASRVPIIASAISGNIDLIKDDFSGRLFKSNSKEELASILIELIENREQRLFLANNAYSEGFNKYRLSTHCDKLKSIYQNSLHTHETH